MVKPAKKKRVLQEGDEIVKYFRSEKDGKMKKLVKRIVKETVRLTKE